MNGQRVTVYVLLTVGEEAYVRFSDRPEEVRMPAATIAADANLPPDELPGRDFYATAEEMEGQIILRNFSLVNDPRI